ncbi:hypothetical protein [Pseudodesulfovibrio profundus]|uniref:hypothetical protein n=1 Tax=Pseudodesulfovibrio profundus TaxID=57320 RepID=UPI0012FF6A07|nr:hypothetical protein [Pseudodesulfovibrio profundus]
MSDFEFSFNQTNEGDLHPHAECQRCKGGSVFGILDGDPMFSDRINYSVNCKKCHAVGEATYGKVNGEWTVKHCE